MKQRKNQKQILSQLEMKIQLKNDAGEIKPKTTKLTRNFVMGIINLGTYGRCARILLMS